MAILSFIGGIHPPERKELAKGRPIQEIPIPKSVYLFVNQNTGKPPAVSVKKGDSVKTGQKIAEAQGPVSVPLHSPVTGVISDIKKVMHPITQKPEELLVIDSETDQFDFLEPLSDWKAYDKEKSHTLLYERIKEAGIVGLGGATFPSHFKYLEAMKKPVDYVILNGAECEPYLTIDDRMMVEHPAQIVGGLEILLKICGASKGYIGVEDNKPEAFEALKKYANDRIEPALVKTKYPQGGEKQMIYALTKRSVPVGGFPIHIGVIVHNVATAFAIYEAVEKGKPLYERGVTVTGEGIAKPGNLWVRVGTPIQELITYAGGLNSEGGKVILGGPMMGVPIKDLTLPVMKGTSGILVLTPEMVSEINETACINCGRCLMACSLRLEPNYLVKLVKAKKFEEAYKYGVLNCCECGSCAYVCPSKIEHVKHFKLAKKLHATLKGGKK